MYTLAELAKQIQTVLGATADQLAKTTDFIKRQRKLTGAKFVLELTPGCFTKSRCHFGRTNTEWRVK